jgi:hypothetical protein
MNSGLCEGKASSDIPRPLFPEQVSMCLVSPDQLGRIHQRCFLAKPCFWCPSMHVVHEKYCASRIFVHKVPYLLSYFASCAFLVGAETHGSPPRNTLPNTVREACPSRPYKAAWASKNARPFFSVFLSPPHLMHEKKILFFASV